MSEEELHAALEAMEIEAEQELEQLEKERQQVEGADTKESSVGGDIHESSAATVAINKKGPKWKKKLAALLNEVGHY